MADRTPKHRAALQVANEVQNDMRLGLGSGSTVYLLVAALGERVKRGELRGIEVVVASRWTETAARAAGLPLADLNDLHELDLAIDGADEIDPQRNLIKGGGGALLRERIVLGAAAQRLIVGDESKLVPTLGERWAVPVEVVQFGWCVPFGELQKLGGSPELRMQDSTPFVTDEGNFILDCHFGPIADAVLLDQKIRSVPGVMAHGLFLGFADRVLIGTADGVREM
jgi:ribose 5-phosphate isomerase A